MVQGQRKIRRILIALLIIAALPLLLLAHPRARAALRITPGFQPLEQDTRVFYEAGAEVYAKQFADALPSAIARVEDCQGQPFRSAFRVYVCASHENFTRYLLQSPDSPVRGMQLYRDVWVSPKAFAFMGLDTHRQTITHELAHLHISQHMGLHRITGGLPTWFVEGLADWVADTGRESVSYRGMLTAFAAGSHFVPDTKGRFFPPKRAKDYGLSWPMLHRQSRAFVEYLVERDKESFKEFVVAVVKGARFDVAFAEHFDGTLETVWDEFLDSLEDRAGRQDNL